MNTKKLVSTLTARFLRCVVGSQNICQKDLSQSLRQEAEGSGPCSPDNHYNG